MAASKGVIRKTTVIKQDDYLLVGASLFLVEDVSAVFWSKEFGRVVVKIKCHPDVIATEVTERSVWDAYICGLV